MDGVLDPVRDARNPLALRSAPPPGYPLRGARFFVDHDKRYGWWPYLRRHPSLRVLAQQPTMKRFGKWDGTFSGARASRYLSRSYLDDPHGIPAIGTMRLHHRTVCSHWSDTAGDEAFFARWIRDLARGVGNFRTIIFLEQDALITVPCLDREGIDRRLREVSDAIGVLSKLPHALVYVDAGAGDALPADYAARLLQRVGVDRIQGFFLNSDHFDWTSREIAYGQQIARLTGTHFIVSTHANGRGPLYRSDPRHQGVEDICNPRGRGLGPLPTTDLHYRWLDAFYWIGNPARSGGACGHRDPKVGDFAPRWAEQLVRLAVHHVR
jgi:endoglucanase